VNEREGGTLRGVRAAGADRFAGATGVPGTLDDQRFADARPVVKAFLLATLLAALVLPLVRSAAAGFRLSVPNVGIALALMLASAANVEIGRLLDKAAREQQRPHKGLSAWAMASVILLPAWYLLPVIAFTYTHAWLRDRHLPRWKWAGSASYMVLAALVARVIQQLPGDGVGLDTRPSILGVGLVVASCLLFMAVEALFLSTFVALNRPQDEMWLRRTLADPLFYATELGVLTLGAVTGLVADAGGWFVLLVAPLFLLMQQAVLHRPLQERADQDSKTGVLHYRAWLRAAAAEAQHLVMERRPWAVLFADIDHFHHFNQTHGHLGGDQALGATADAIRRALPPGTLIGRFGGEEFCALLPGAVRSSGLAAAERVRLRVSAMRPPLLPGRITVSIGVGLVEPGERDATVARALALADRALYRAKQDGRDCCRAVDGSSAGDGPVG
jgi:diguanylate cyclase (GGDEF)-like protein